MKCTIKFIIFKTNEYNQLFYNYVFKRYSEWTLSQQNVYVSHEAVRCRMNKTIFA